MEEKCLISFLVQITTFFHKGIITHTNRPYQTIEEMNEDLIRRWNSVVGKKDLTYYVGDFAFMNHASIRMRINGKIELVIGNHDKMSLAKYQNLFTNVHDLLYLRRFDPHIMLCHYPMRSWKNSVHGTQHLYGHCHGRMLPLGLSFDVGVDCWNYYPISYEQVQEKMKTLQMYKEYKDEG
jgi:calcineurin-like phosphoesterase family protein